MMQKSMVYIISRWVVPQWQPTTLSYQKDFLNAMDGYIKDSLTNRLKVSKGLGL